MSTPSPTSSTIHWDPPEVNSGTTTSWIPLTTTWSAPAGCESSFFLYPGQQLPVAWDPGFGWLFSGTPRCLPPAATTWWEQGHQGGDGFTSLSIRPLVCPDAFTTAATSVRSKSSTAVLCCPSGYDLQDNVGTQLTGLCFSPLTSGQTFQYVAQTFVSGSTTTVTMTSSVSSAASIRGIPMQGWNVDMPSSTPISKITSGGNDSASRTGSVALSTQTQIGASTSSTGGLSTGAKAGVGVSLAIGALGLLAFVGAFCLLKRRPGGAKYGRIDGGKSAPVYEMPARALHELQAKPDPYEIDQRSLR